MFGKAATATAQRNQNSSDPWTSNDNDGSDGRRIPFPHLLRERHYDTKELEMVGGARDKRKLNERKKTEVNSAKIYAKSYFYAGAM